jgi:hypothetical protein
MYALQDLLKNQQVLDVMIEQFMKDCPLRIFLNPRLINSKIEQASPTVIRISFRVLEDGMLGPSLTELVYRLLPTGIAHSEFLQFSNLIYVVPVQEWLDYIQNKQKALRFMNQIKEELMATVWTPENVEKWLDSGVLLD